MQKIITFESSEIIHQLRNLVDSLKALGFTSQILQLLDNMVPFEYRFVKLRYIMASKIWFHPNSTRILGEISISRWFHCGTSIGLSIA